jgi:hypothetical protein
MENIDELNELLDFLKESSKSTAYNLAYNILTSNKESALVADVPTSDKIKTIEEMILFFTGTEEYEKCAYLYSLKLEIINNENGKINS